MNKERVKAKDVPLGDTKNQPSTNLELLLELTRDDCLELRMEAARDTILDATRDVHCDGQVDLEAANSVLLCSRRASLGDSKSCGVLEKKQKA